MIGCGPGEGQRRGDSTFQKEKVSEVAEARGFFLCCGNTGGNSAGRQRRQDRAEHKGPSANVGTDQTQCALQGGSHGGLV